MFYTPKRKRELFSVLNSLLKSADRIASTNLRLKLLHVTRSTRTLSVQTTSISYKTTLVEGFKIFLSRGGRSEDAGGAFARRLSNLKPHVSQPHMTKSNRDIKI